MRNLSNFIGEVTSNSAQMACDDRPIPMSFTRLGWWPKHVEREAVPSPLMKGRSEEDPWCSHTSVACLTGL